MTQESLRSELEQAFRAWRKPRSHRNENDADFKEKDDALTAANLALFNTVKVEQQDSHAVYVFQPGEAEWHELKYYD